MCVLGKKLSLKLAFTFVKNKYKIVLEINGMIFLRLNKKQCYLFGVIPVC